MPGRIAVTDKPAPPTPLALDPAENRRKVRPDLDWKPGADATYTDIRYETAIAGPDTGTAKIAKITISRPEVRNAFRPRTLFELMNAFERARDDRDVGVIV